mmetsp:Transcript_78583/g.230550  ORF Transcript_78583/g.230550 Transcript_78583/m.230550 type:complete len:342 (+) Transcript_78583:41-1066(+)
MAWCWMALPGMALWLAPWGLAEALGAAAAPAGGSASDAVSLLQSGPGLAGGHFYYMHIPRTAGTSFALDTNKILAQNFNLLNPLTLESKEGCYKWRDRGGVSWVATMVRSPRNHVLSQYLLCGEGTIALMTSVQKGPGGFGLWVNEWRDIFRRGKFAGDYTALDGEPQHKNEQYLLFSSMPHKCYNPINLQTHHFTCTHPFIYEKNGTDIELALSNMKKTRFVGIQEAYQESVCLFASKVKDEMPEFCDCRNEAMWNSFEPAGHFSSHSHKGKTPRNVTRHGQEVLQQIDEITALDRIVYKAAIERFIGECRLVEEKFSKKILCEDKMQQLQELANLAPEG